jgi:glucose-1-phosphate thymidylyltransferase
MKGIILAGGTGSRLFPLTQVFSKQLLPIYDKPMIYYPLSVLMLAGVRDILIITTESDHSLFRQLLGDGSLYGINLDYMIQPQPNGIGEAFILAENFIGQSSVSLILGDNIFFGYQFVDMLQKASKLKNGARIFTTIVNNPEDFGVAELDAEGNLISIEEKPLVPKSNLAITGLYFYDNSVIEVAKSIKPSQRGEIEITDINKFYLASNSLKVSQLGRGFSWLDTGTHDALISAGEFVRTIETRQGLKIACLEEIAYMNDWIDKATIQSQAKKYNKTEYGKYLSQII